MGGKDILDGFNGILVIGIRVFEIMGDVESIMNVLEEEFSKVEKKDFGRKGKLLFMSYYSYVLYKK